MKVLILMISLLVSGLAAAHGGHDHGHDERPRAEQPRMSHLTFANGALHAHATWLAGPQVGAESILQIEWMNGADHSPIEPVGSFSVVLWMPSMGHGSAPTVINRIINPQGQPQLGAFQVSRMYFVMGGDWDVEVTLTFPDGTSETQIIKVQL